MYYKFSNQISHLLDKYLPDEKLQEFESQDEKYLFSESSIDSSDIILKRQRNVNKKSVSLKSRRKIFNLDLKGNLLHKFKKTSVNLIFKTIFSLE